MRLYALYEVDVSATLAPQFPAIVTNMYMSFFSFRGSGGKTGTATTPARTHARNDMMYSSDGSKTRSSSKS